MISCAPEEAELIESGALTNKTERLIIQYAVIQYVVIQYEVIRKLG